jgi:hypothetical protein
MQDMEQINKQEAFAAQTNVICSSTGSMQAGPKLQSANCGQNKRHTGTLPYPSPVS